MSRWHELGERLAVGALRWSPKGAFTRSVGWLSRRRVPRFLRAPLYGAFANWTGADLAAVDRPLRAFDRFDEFFTRPLSPGLRPVIPGADVAVCPCDGRLSESGLAEDGRLLQCKGRDYTIRGLLADEDEARHFDGGAYATIYLAPRDYHRVHAPTSGVVTGYRHIPGALFPVNPMSVRQVAGLFSINERIVIYLDGPLGRVAVVMVAATGVGFMSLAFEAQANYKPHSRSSSAHRYATPLPIRKADELGAFHLGSTVVVLFQAGRVALSGLERGQLVRVGEELGRRASGRSGEVVA